ncbi:YdgH/BhsA/McbA-like domain containing protein [Lonsdalea britannica]|uniref:multiple stress resistance protein BhsA n=1 Tax=Lonsdalea britannica TaxID=1082704 RepID=UPI0026EFC3C5|nr:YdgH/BhsA/McbA-like domain containing protein [Lonsdalea britannica]
MKNVKIIVAAAVLSTLSFGSYAAKYISVEQAQNMEKIGEASDTGRDLSTLQQKFSAKADEVGATSYTITKTTGDQVLHGTANFYK